jgi:hypothetical protein
MFILFSVNSIFAYIVNTKNTEFESINLLFPNCDAVLRAIICSAQELKMRCR